MKVAVIHIMPCIAIVGVDWTDDMDKEVYLYAQDKGFFYGENEKGRAVRFNRQDYKIKKYVCHDFGK